MIGIPKKYESDLRTEFRFELNGTIWIQIAIQTHSNKIERNGQGTSIQKICIEKWAIKTIIQIISKYASVSQNQCYIAIKVSKSLN